MQRALVLVALAALALAPSASAHPGTAERGYVSTVSGLSPPVLGVSVTVLGGDDRLSLRNWSGREVVVLGYEGEPYLRFTAAGVYQNALSPAAYLNRYRFPPVEVPAGFDRTASPHWVAVAPGTSYAWHDHRIHWTGKAPPPGVQGHPRRNQRIFLWEVAATVAGRPFTIEGFLGYAPPPFAPADEAGGGSSSAPALVAGLVALLALLAGLPLLLLRRRGASQT